MDADERLAFLPMRDERAAAAVEGVPQAVRFKTFHFIDPDGTGHSGGTAVIRTLASVKSTSWLGRLLGIKPFPVAVNVFYALLARSRGVVGKLVKDAPGPERWP